jgi:hypothetical protein
MVCVRERGGLLLLYLSRGGLREASLSTAIGSVHEGATWKLGSRGHYLGSTELGRCLLTVKFTST